MPAKLHIFPVDFYVRSVYLRCIN